MVSFISYFRLEKSRLYTLDRPVFALNDRLLSKESFIWFRLDRLDLFWAHELWNVCSKDRLLFVVIS